MTNPVHESTYSQLSLFHYAATKACCLILFISVVLAVNAGLAHSAARNNPPDLQTETASEDLPYNILDDENIELKRQARLQGARMRSLYGPQMSYHSSFIDADDEAGSRHTIGAVMPLSELWEASLFDNFSFFALKNGGKRAARESIDLRLALNPGRTFRPWLTLTPYFNLEEARGGRLGLGAGLTKTWTNGAILSAEAYAWRPWDEGYSTIIEDGEKYGAEAAFTLPVTKWFQLIGRAFYEELELGEGAKSGAQYAGNRYVLNGRAYLRLFHRDGAFMDYGFRSEDLKNEYLIGTELGIFAHVDFQRYFKPDEFHAINPVPEVFAQEIGMSFQYAISPRLGVTGEGFIGRDPDRDLQFGELYGMRGRLLAVVNPHLRVWADAAYLKTNTTLESSGGRETTISIGLNYAF